MTTEQTINEDFTWPGQPYPVYSGKAPDTAITALSWGQVSTATGSRKLRVTNRDGKAHDITVEKHTLHVIDRLMRGPIKSASLPRIGEYVRILRHELDVEIHCERYDGNSHGCYHLISQVEPVEEQEAA